MVAFTVSYQANYLQIQLRVKRLFPLIRSFVNNALSGIELGTHYHKFTIKDSMYHHHIS